MNKNDGQVIKLFISNKESSKRQNKSEIYLDKEGVVGDKFYHKDQQRAVLVTSLESYTLALDHRILMEHGTLGENILIDFNPYLLAKGTQLKIGEVIIEIAQNCTICNHLSVIDKSLPVLLKKDRGIFVKVIKEGIIKEKDLIVVLEKKVHS